MIPLQLTLKNFLSYRSATIDFSGLHTACICGSNGAGKSSLLEAITWAVWGESRAVSEDDTIHAGAEDVRVDFTFTSNQHNYRVIRTRHRGQSSSLEFQVATTNGFRSLTERGVRATQQLILEHIKLDYETFINSAYLRQGRADEFMLKGPKERKEILVQLLKLNQYDELEERAKDLSRQFKGQTEQLTLQLQSIAAQLQQQEATRSQLNQLKTQHQQLQNSQTVDTEQLQKLQAFFNQRQTWMQQLGLVKQQAHNLTQDSDRLQQELAANQEQQQLLATFLEQEAEIAAGFTQYQNLQAQEQTFTEKFQKSSSAQQQRQHLQQQMLAQINELQRQLQRVAGQLESLKQDEQDIQQTLKLAPEVEAGLAQLALARTRLSEMDRLQLQVAPLRQHRVTIQSQLERVQARMQARIDELQVSHSQLINQQQLQPKLQQAVIDVTTRIEQLDKKRVYLERVKEKGQERRSFMERLEAQEQSYKQQLAELEQKLQMLTTPDVPCPLCDRPLNEHHWHRVMEKTQAQEQEIQDLSWVLREQLAVSERERQVLRQEYRELSQELANYDVLREQRGQLAAQLSAMDDVKTKLQEIVAQKQQVEQALQAGDYAPNEQAELRQIDRQLEQFNYSEQDHALARNEVERWRWADIKQGQIKEATRRQAQVTARRPELQAQINSLKAKIEQQQSDSECSRAITALDCYIAEIDYDPEQHTTLRASLHDAQIWQSRYQQLCLAQQQHPLVQKRSQDLTQLLQTRLAQKQELAIQIAAIIQQIEQTPDTTTQSQALEQQIQQRRRQLDEQLGQLGRLQQLFTQLETLQTQHSQQQQQLLSVRQQNRVYQELALAFGKNGIQALMIENVLPQLEAETNQLLSRLSVNQLHVQFVTQKAGRSSRGAKKATKLIDTLDILIADPRGTRPYETYSGGEAFRINFAIRLALARLLAGRAGAALQLLIIDEGFGTQDAEGCERLVAAINAIAPDFACILAVTHMPHLKEAFQARIEISKTAEGSRINLSI